MAVKTHISKVELEPIEHVYIHRDTGIKYTSVTKVISSIEKHFDSEGVAMAIANQADEVRNPKYIGMNKHQILLEWKRINDEANIYGTKIHNTIENYLLKDKWYKPVDELEAKVIKAYNEVNIDEGVEIYPERIMFSEEYELAGMSDLIIKIDNEFFDVGDYKGLPIDTPILTDSGWKTMGSIDISDKVYDMNGELTRILHTSEIKNKKCYEIKFDNNETIVSDFEHRWLVSFYRDKKFKDIVMTTEELHSYLNELNKSNKRWSHKLPKIKIAKPLNNEKIELPIDPYVLGVWLGDGHSADSKITNMNDKVWLEIKKRGYEIGDDVSQGSSGKASTRTIFDMRGKLNDLDLLMNKHLPTIYLFSSYEQRLDLLRGFMDADGYYNKNRKRFVMTTTKKWHVEATVKLLSSLGIKTIVLPCKKKCNGKSFNGYDICFTTNNLNPFLCRNQKGIKYVKRNHNTFKNITSINEVESVPTRCIEVESKTSTFLYGHSFSVTHNTNKEFNFFSKYKQMLLKPFDYLSDCQYSVYTIQLSVYALMMEMETGMKCRHMYVLYWNRETEKLQKIPILYVKEIALKLMGLHKYRKSIEK